MEEPKAKKPRIRGKNFSISEVDILKDSVKENMHIINAKHCNGTGEVTKKAQDLAWLEICRKVNSVGVCKRSVDDVKEKWRNLKKKAKAEVADRKKHMTGTGGGPPAPIVDPVLADIADLYKDSAAFCGIQGATDAETIIVTFSDSVGTKASQDAVSLGVAEEHDNLCTQSMQSMLVAAEASTNGCATACEPFEWTQSVGAGCSTAVSYAEPVKPGCSAGVSHAEPVKAGCSKAVSHAEPAKKSEKLTLKDLQMKFYRLAAANEEAKARLLQEEKDLCKLKSELFKKLSCLLDKVNEKLNTQ